jgi:tetratricopeptide (TPR) repeat protein
MSTRPRTRIEKRISEAEGYLMLEMPEHALAALRGISDDEVENGTVSFLRGDALRHLGKHEQALQSFDRVYARDPDNVSLLMAMAWCYKRTDRLDRAIEAMEHAYRVSPKQPIVLYNLSCYWSLAGNKTQALSWLGRALRMDESLRKLIEDEQDFDPLRRDPDFRQLLSLFDEPDRMEAK